MSSGLYRQWSSKTPEHPTDLAEPLDLEVRSVAGRPAGLVHWEWFHAHRRALYSCWGSSSFHVLVVILLACLWTTPDRHRDGVLLTGEADRRNELQLTVVRIESLQPPKVDGGPHQQPGETTSAPATQETAETKENPEPPRRATSTEDRNDKPQATAAKESPEADQQIKETVESTATEKRPSEPRDLTGKHAGKTDDRSQPDPVTIVAEKSPDQQLPDPAGGLRETPSEIVPTDQGVEFFGIQSAGTRFVFLVDCSRSMAGLRWDQAGSELLRAIRSLKTDQFFYVIFFDDTTHRMFNVDHPQTDLLPATPKNVQRLTQWIPTIKLGYQTQPAEAIHVAIELKPDALFVLSDGEFDRQAQEYLRNINRGTGAPSRPVAVHTISLHSRKGGPMLQRIARENGGEYRYVENPTPPSKVFFRERKDGSKPQAIHALLAAGAEFEIDEEDRIYRVFYRGGDNGLAQLKFLANLRELWLADSSISDKGMDSIAALTKLRHLVLSSCAISDHGLRRLAPLSQLEGLFLQNTQVTNSGLGHLTQRSLRTLSTPGTLTDDGLKHLQEMSRLETLYLMEPRITDEGLAYLKDLTHLQELHLDNSGIDGSGLRHLHRLTRLRHLSLRGTHVTDAAMAHLVSLQRLQTLNLEQTPIGDASLPHLAKLKQLRNVIDGETELTLQGRRTLRRLQDRAGVVDDDPIRH